MELDRRRDITWEEKLAYLTYRFLDRAQTKCPVEHRFEPGLYIRVMRIPKETLFIGRPHLIGHMCQLVEGKLLLITEHKKQIRQAPDFIQTVPGFQTVVYTMTDVIAHTIHQNPLDEQDTDMLEQRFFGPVESLRTLGERVASRVDVLESPADMLAIKELVS